MRDHLVRLGRRVDIQWRDDSVALVTLGNMVGSRQASLVMVEVLHSPSMRGASHSKAGTAAGSSCRLQTLLFRHGGHLGCILGRLLARVPADGGKPVARNGRAPMAVPRVRLHRRRRSLPSARAAASPASLPLTAPFRRRRPTGPADCVEVRDPRVRRYFRFARYRGNGSPWGQCAGRE